MNFSAYVRIVNKLGFSSFTLAIIAQEMIVSLTQPLLFYIMYHIGGLLVNRE